MSDKTGDERAVPALTETYLRKLAMRQGASTRQAKQYARHIVTAPWFPALVEQYTFPESRAYSDPTAEAAILRILRAAME